MSLTQRVQDKLKAVKAGSNNKDKEAAIRRAEELADKFHYVKPKMDIASAEQYMGLTSTTKFNFMLDR